MQIFHRALFAATMFTAAALVFLVQPMAAKQLLPEFGGTPAVWNVSVVFFQLALLLGYGLAHVSATRLAARRQGIAQLVLAALAVAFLPFALATDHAGDAPPSVRVVLLLAVGVGLPYLAVASASPLLQRWYASLGHADSSQPWFLYVASNAGSLLGLLAFPFLLEPRLSTAGQEWAWVVAYGVYVAGLFACVLLLWRRAGRISAVDAHTTDVHQPQQADPIGRARATSWVLIAALPSALMLGVTTFITTDVASAPLLWVLPLALYLLSFMVTFGRRVRVNAQVAGAALAAVSILLLLVELERIDADPFARIGVHLAAMFLAAVLAHARLYADRPAAGQLTAFYFLMSLGGAIGGTFMALAAPLLLPDVYEYPLLLVAALALRPQMRAPRRLRSDQLLLRVLVTIGELAVAAYLVFALEDAARGTFEFDPLLPLWGVVIIGVLLATRRWGLVVATACLFALLAFSDDAEVLHRDRNFFGTLRVERGEDTVELLHGTTLHGTQLRAPDRRRVPTTYYTKEGPLGDVFRLLQADEPFVEIGAVGLGTGTLLGHATMWQRYTFFEIDPAVIDVAKDPRYFTWLSDADVTTRIVEGDARLLLERERASRYDLLVLDAYSSDAVPVHLLTVEAMRTYLRALAPDGAMALHVSSRHLDLAPVVAANASRLGLTAIHRDDEAGLTAQADADGAQSHWIVLTRDPADLRPLDTAPGWLPLTTMTPQDAWTDDFSDVVGAIRWIPWN